MRFKNLYCTYDRVAMVYGENLFTAYNDEEAKRAFHGHMLKQVLRPQDFILMRVGKYDRMDGCIESSEHYDEKVPHVFISEGEVTKAPEDNVVNIEDHKKGPEK